MAARMSLCWCRCSWLRAAAFLAFFSASGPARSMDMSSLFLFFVFSSPLRFFPRTVRLRRSSSTRSTLPSAMASPSSMHASSCRALMFLTAGGCSFAVHGVGVSSWRVEVELPMTASRIMRAKQWSRWTGQVGWEVALVRARLGRVQV